ncbi:hypothetical protein K2173_010773 [Erythroxylum novogranatense]|uniref:tetraacyldisaccharide 4'-kinase n=1 Tax=Erythroxylum novogranatense TaxID=1862640 RepID=A0AAV8SQY0_9ROSI|nr:hypothetical protein K2173_010773 [Erythroxylum novogranatense]
MIEKLRRIVNEIAYAQDLAKLSALHRSLVPFLTVASSLYDLALSLRRCLYNVGFFSKSRLPVPVISVGNVTWGGNGKTPMVEFIALLLAEYGISPLILTRGYAGGDEVKMLARHLLGRPVRIGVGANRAATAAHFFNHYGYIGSQNCLLKGIWPNKKAGDHHNLCKIGAVVLDDGMQHWSLHRDVEIVMINGLMPWGNQQLLPLGPLREPLSALQRADVAVVHHATLVSEEDCEHIKIMIQGKGVKRSLPIFFTSMSPSCFLEIGNVNSMVSLDAVNNAILLCICAIGSADAFVQGVKKMGALYVDRLDFSDHYFFQARDIELIRMKLRELKVKFESEPIVVTTEKDYYRDQEILRLLNPYKVLVLCSELQVLPYGEHNEDNFKKLLKELLEVKLSSSRKE